LPSTPALAILVVLVITDCGPAVDGALAPNEPQPLASVTTTAVSTAVEAATTPTRRAGRPATSSSSPLISTPPTVTSGLLAAGQAANLGCRCAFTTVCRTYADIGPAER
jgi:hypothetical protein